MGKLYICIYHRFSIDITIDIRKTCSIVKPTNHPYYSEDLMISRSQLPILTHRIARPWNPTWRRSPRWKMGLTLRNGWFFDGELGRCTFWCQNSYWKYPLVVDVPIKNGGSFHMSNYHIVGDKVSNQVFFSMLFVSNMWKEVEIIYTCCMYIFYNANKLQW